MAETLLFNLSNFGVQEYPFPEKLMKYVNEKADAETKQKLDRTCKHFYKELPYLIVDSLIADNVDTRIENEMFDRCMDIASDDMLQWNRIQNIWVTKKLKTPTQNPSFGKVVRCDARIVSFFDDNELSFDKFKMLTKSGNVETLKCSSVIFLDGSKAFLEDILALIPNASKIKITKCHVSTRPMTMMFAISWKQKLCKLRLYGLNGPVLPHLFFEFVKIHTHRDAKINVSFTDSNYTKQFKEWYNIKAEIKKLPKMKYYPNKPLTFDEDGIERQYFDFPYFVMEHIRKNANAQQRRKLYQTCKYFHKKDPYCIVDDITCYEEDDRIEFKIDGKSYVKYLPEIQSLSNIWITNKLEIWGRAGSLLTKITRCKATKVEVCFSDGPINVNQLKILTGSGLVTRWYSSVIIMSDDGNIICLDELLYRLPNAKRIGAAVFELKSHKPFIFSSSHKIQHLTLQFFEPINAGAFFDILTKVVASKAYVEVSLPGDLHYLETFKEEIKAKLKTWKPQIDRPSIVIDSFEVD